MDASKNLTCFVSILVFGALVAGPSCRQAEPPQTPARPFQLFRFDDELSSATVSASSKGSFAQMGEPIRWEFNGQLLGWKPLRGRVGFRYGELALQGQGSTPVIQAPSEPSVDWSRYETVAVRMIAEAGNEIKIRIGSIEKKQSLGPPLQYRVYRFDLDVTNPSYGHPLAIMPTDDALATVAIDYIEIIPRTTAFTEAAGRQVIGKRDEYRNVLYVQAPSSIAYEVDVPRQARLHFGVGIIENKPVTFRVLAAADSREVYSKALDEHAVWDDAAVDLSSYEGQNTRLVFQTNSTAEGAVALWSNPLLTTTAPKNRHNVLLYVVCTLRPDHTSLYGYPRETTPYLKKLGTSSVVFDDCQAQATWTKPSVASLMTSLFSFAHGIQKDTDTIPKGAVTLAERLRAAGYVTAGVVSNPFAGRVTGLERGFDYMMEHPVVERHANPADRGTDSSGVNRVVFPWLGRHRDEPFFLYVQAADPHAPYQPPAEFESQFASAAETPDFDRDYDRVRRLRGYGGGAAVSRAECIAKGIDPELYRKRAIDRYDAEIAHNDRNIRLLVERLQELGILEDTLLVIVSDHGEEFWEHGWSAHGHSLYRELAHTVFLMSNPKLLPEPRRVPDAVQLIDVMPTILDLLGVKREGIVQGRSLVSLARGLPSDRTGPAMSSRFTHPNFKPGGLPENRTGTVALIDSRWKLIYRDNAKRAGLPELELYDRRIDRAEANNVAARHSGEVDKLMTETREWIEAQRQVRELIGPGGRRQMDPKTLERLRSLGYIGGPAPAKPEGNQEE